MLLTNPERYNFYKYENELRKGIDSFTVYLDNVLKTDGIDAVLNVLKGSGLAVNIFNNSKRKRDFKQVIDHILEQLVKKTDLSKVESMKLEIEYIEYLFNQFLMEREEFFEEFEKIEDNYKVVSYLLSLEIYLSTLRKRGGINILKNIPLEDVTDFNTRQAFWDSAIESTGLILKYFKFKHYEFKGVKRNIGPKTLESSAYHIFYSEFWNTLNDLLEYWQYSEVSVKKDEKGKFHFNIQDENFELNNLISNERFNNLRQSWQMGKVGEYQQVLREKVLSPDEAYKKINNELSILFAFQYFGDPLLKKKVGSIKLSGWIRAYQLLVDECEKFLKKRKEVSVFNVDNYCFSKPINKWEKYFQQAGFTKEESKEIIKIFTFDHTSQDLIDCPFIRVDENLILIPSLTSKADISRALASNFLNRNLDLAFRGPEFEERMKVALQQCNLKNSSLFKRTDEDYECDIAFVLDDELYFVECKAHVQPFTTRQHANHLYKLFKETKQLNRIADFFEENIPIVIEQLKLNKSFKPKKVHRILLTTSMLGTPIFTNDVYIVDESSLLKFIGRNPPALHYFNKGKNVEIPSSKFEIYEGELSNTKFLKYLNSPPQIQITKDLFNKKELEFDLFNIERNIKTNETMHLGNKFSKAENELIKKHYSNLSF
ncbi:hypothetical protein M3205_23810 [Cytobacillus firmus]|uniref:hypothetical protein n=1 Tax=Cytobacillus firmus TaxID=1399 RepID=UPI002040FD39|nr:hypothetical protein [Cytobacillus firmus]MCM3708672.1 hypothetical protein [Cytobacillus firmus]